MLYTAAAGPFESLIQRALFVLLITLLGVCLHPLGAGRRWRPLGLALDLAAVAVVATATAYIIVNFETIMNERPFATELDVWLAAGTTLVILELARRAVSIIFPLLVVFMLLYALLGQHIPGTFGHRGFDIYFVSETVFLGDLGLWGMLVGIASTTLAAFVLFGAFLLHTGAGQTFFDLSARASGATPGGAAKIATLASGFFGMISGSTVANVATTGNFTIPLMRRLRYPPAYAGGVEAVASTGGQLAPPIMGTAAFVMAELVGVNYWQIAAAAILPAVLFYLGVFTTVHVAARHHQVNAIDPSELPAWRTTLDWKRLAPIIAALAGIVFGIANGNSVQLSAAYGIYAIIVAFIAAQLAAGHGLLAALRQLLPALLTGGKGIVVVGILLTAAQVFIALINLTGVGVTLTGAILSAAGEQLWLIALVMAAVCLIAGMGLPTSAAYVLVAAVFAPAMIQLGLDALTVHFFVLYYATLSVITPPVCVGVFVAATIAHTHWWPVALQALRLGATAYALPMLFLLYPGLLGNGGGWAIAQAATVGVAFTLATAFLLGGQPVGGYRHGRWLWLVPLLLALAPTAWFWGAPASLLLIGIMLSSRRLRAATVP